MASLDDEKPTVSGGGNTDCVKHLFKRSSACSALLIIHRHRSAEEMLWCLLVAGAGKEFIRCFYTSLGHTINVFFNYELWALCRALAALLPMRGACVQASALWTETEAPPPGQEEVL